MRGSIRTSQKCPVCKGKFVHQKGVAYFCQKCKTQPTRFFIDVYDDQGKRHQLFSDKLTKRPFSSYQQAWEALVRINHEIEQGTFNPNEYSTKTPVDVYFEVRWEKFVSRKEREYKAGSLSKGYIQQIRSYEYYILSFFRGKSVMQIRRGDIEDFKDFLFSTKRKKDEEEGLSPKTVKNILGLLNQFFNHLRDDGWIREVPVFPKVKVPEPEIQTVSEEVQGEILKFVAFEMPEHFPIMLFIMMQGVRPGEACALKWKDIDLKEKKVTIQRTFSARELRETTKGGRARVIPLHEEVVEVLKALRKEKPGLPEAFVFRQRNGNPYKDYTINRIWKRIRESLGLPEGVKFYGASRHSFGTILLKKGIGVEFVRRFMGHADIRTTKRYLHLAPDDLRVVVDVLSPRGLDGDSGNDKRRKSLRNVDFVCLDWVRFPCASAILM